jgi:L-asparaginase
VIDKPEQHGVTAPVSLLVITTGGTIDKVYFDASSEYEVGEPTVPHVFRESGVTLPWRLHPLFRKDSLEMNDDDRTVIRRACEEAPENHILVTHGTDTMCETAMALAGISGKTIVLTGALAPARFRVTDAVFNLGLALGAVQSMPPGVYLAMNGTVFSAGKVRKNRDVGRFEPLEEA